MNYIYSIVFKYSHTSCLQAPFLGVIGFHKYFLNIYSILSLSSHATNCLFHLMSSFITLSYLVLNISTTPQHHMNLFSPTSSRYEKTFQFCILFSIFSLAISPRSCTQHRPISPLTPNVFVLKMLLILVGCHFLIVPSNIHQRHP